ncbi:MAG: hypothetical protein P1P72_07050 [ANME-2 cluster archaeon]|nr:hypothetical protein [ANME-2 cluster archaeon]
MTSDYESFWDADSFAVVTDRTKPAMKWTIHELTRRGKNVSTVDISDKPDAGTFRDVSELPDGVQGAVIGITGKQPAVIMDALAAKGISNIWVHFSIDTPEVRENCGQDGMHCVTGKCPMMYLGGSISIHGIHRNIAKLIGKY